VTTHVVGASVARVRDAELLTGAGRFVADVDVPGQAWARVVRSPVARASLGEIDVSAALDLAGVVAILTAEDLPDLTIPIRLPFAATENAGRALQPVLAQGVVRYVGEPVALVVAKDPWIAEDAAELVVFDFDLEDPAADLVSSASDGSPLVHAALGTNVVDTIATRYGEVEAAFASADLVLRRRLELPRQTGAPLETRGLVAEPTARGLTIWGAAKVKHFNRTVIAELLGLDPRDVRLVEVDVGGGFGVRGELYPEDVLVPLAALRLGRPVKWIEDRSEHLVATNHARAQVHEVDIAAAGDGRLLALRGVHWVDQGAYVRTQGILPTLLPASHLPGPYVWDAFELTAHAVLTNRTPVGTYRGPGMTEATFVRERMLDLLAAQLDLDPAELRRRNLIRASSMPFAYDLGPGAPPIVYETGDFAGSFERLLEESQYEELKSDKAQGVGVGLAASVELGAIGPFEEASVEVRADGRVRVRAGVGSLGQGIETALAQIAADELGVSIDSVDVRHHDTDDVASGFGSFASRSTVLAGNAVALACRALLERADEEGVERVALGEVSGRFEKAHPSYSFNASLAVVSVDAETGQVRSLRHAVLHDVGRAVNPELVEGQLVGAAMQGIAGALLEELPYDASGQPLARSLADYRVPTGEEAPSFQTILVEHPVADNPLGVKGAGEAGIVGAPAAVANAVADALPAEAGEVLELPLTPQRVHALARPAVAST
jgi:aerobic carbon-monoxide dehydrogenase large subunit